jgi:hypothetical protein
MDSVKKVVRTLEVEDACRQAKGRAGGDGIGGRERRTGKGSSWSYLSKDKEFGGDSCEDKEV